MGLERFFAQQEINMPHILGNLELESLMHT